MWIKVFVDYLRFERNLSERTVEAYQADLEAFKQFYKNLNSELSWKTVDSDIVRDWEVSMMDNGNSASSVNRRLSALRSFYRFLLRRKMVAVDPVHNLQGPKKEKSLPYYIRESEMNRLLEGIRSLLISEENLEHLGTDFSFDDYKEFYDEKFAPLTVPNMDIDEPVDLEFKDPDEVDENEKSKNGDDGGGNDDDFPFGF